MRLEGWEITCQQEEVVLQLSGLHSTVGHIDGKASLLAQASQQKVGQYPVLPLDFHSHMEQSLFLLEIKSMGDNEWKQFQKSQWDTPGLIQKYKWQLSIYMLSLNLPAILVAKNRNNGKLSFTLLTEPFYTLQDIRSRVELIEKSSYDALPDCDTKDWFCAFKYLHDDEEVVITDDNELEEMGRAYLEIIAKEKQLGWEKKGLRAKILEKVKEPTEVTLKSCKVIHYTMENTKWDKERLEEFLAEHGEIADHFTTTNPTSGLRVIDLEDKDEG